MSKKAVDSRGQWSIIPIVAHRKMSNKRAAFNYQRNGDFLEERTIQR